MGPYRIQRRFPWLLIEINGKNAGEGVSSDYITIAGSSPSGV